MSLRLRHLARLCAATVAVLATLALVPARAEAVPFTLNSTSTITALGGTHTLGTSCVGFIGSTGSCGTWAGIPPVSIAATTTVTGTLNTAGSTIVVAGPWLDVTLIDPSAGNCTLRIAGPRTLTYSSSRYRLNSTVGTYSFGTCPANTQTFIVAQLGASPSSATFNAAWSVS